MLNKEPKLGGSLFIRNGVLYDYCFAEALDSLCTLCDKVVVLDCGSTDNTLDVLMEVQQRHPNLLVKTDGDWSCRENYERLRVLADVAKSYLTDVDWHFCLQGDEVIHENSFKAIRNAIKSDRWESYMCRRCNLFGDLYHYLGYSIPQEKKPVSDVVCRLAKIHFNSAGDAESLGVNPATCCQTEVDNIFITHYGFVRLDKNHLMKILNMQSWFWGKNSRPDQRVVEMAEKGDKYIWQELKSRNLLEKISWKHPQFIQNWVDERQKLLIPVED